MMDARLITPEYDVNISVKVLNYRTHEIRKAALNAGLKLCRVFRELLKITW